MSCHELQEYYELYALGVAEGEERRELDEHLARSCPACAGGVRRAREMAAAMALAAPEVEPPRRLRARVLALARPAEEKRSSINWLTHAWATAAVLMLAAVLWYAQSARNLQGQAVAQERRLAEAQTLYATLVARNRQLTEALALINLPDARQVVFGEPDRQPPRGRVWLHPQRGVLLLASRLPQAPAGKIYEMWIIRKGAAPTPAGLFNSDPRGEAFHVWSQPVYPAVTVAVTLEPEGGVPAPTSTPLIVASL